jgi:hypothetical protein
VTGAATHVRRLAGGGELLTDLVVWSEVFADCDAPPVAVRWSRPRALLPDGRIVSPSGYECRYQRFEQGGCTNSDSRVDDDGVVQITNTERSNPSGSRLGF